MVNHSKHKHFFAILVIIVLAVILHLMDFSSCALEKSIGFKLHGLDKVKHEIFAEGELYNYQSVIYGHYKVHDLKRLINDLSAVIDDENSMRRPRMEYAPWRYDSLPKDGFTKYSNMHMKNRKYNLILIEKESLVWSYKGSV